MLSVLKSPDAPKRRILLVEDDPTLRSNYETLLGAHRFDVTACETRNDAVAAFVDEQFDIVILDVTLGAEYEAGFDLCRQFREMNKTVPIIFLTEHDDEADRISGLRMGADDYLGKTISGAYLAARVNALLRRVDALRAETASPLPVHGPDQGSFLRIDDRLSRAYWEGHPLELSLTQFWILRELFSNAGVVRSVSELMRAANITVQPNTIVVHIKSIREEIQRFAPDFSCIKSERARGYRWVEG
ncbi:response regulator transcription factor [Mesorhizobium australicum]|uniref:response regulator transcription factor n=1 Tax=Mesorhizobium australicum TaxID=536018 RepID=UPI00333CDB4A